MDDLQERLRRIGERFEEAESYLKEIENFVGELVIPAINELRYAGKHLLRAARATDAGVREEEFRRAENHCARAIYDATEAGVVYCLDQARDFVEDYKTIAITEVVSDYITLKARFREAQGFIGSFEDAEARGEYAAQCAKFFRELRPAVERLEDARDELNKKTAWQRTQRFWWAVAAIIALLGVIVRLL